MDSLMSNKGGFVAKPLSTFGANVRFFFRVIPLVPNEVMAVNKAFPAFRALEGFLSGVDSLVRLQLRRPVEAFPTF